MFFKNHKNNIRRKIYLRSAIITPNYIGKRVYIHRGNFLVKIDIISDHVGLKFGELILTRKKYTKNKKKKNG